MFLNRLEFQRYIQASAHRANLGVKWIEGATPMASSEFIILPVLGAGATELDYRKLLHYANHEVNHVLYTDFEGYKEGPLTSKILGATLNCVEDHRIEWLGNKEYEGDRCNADEVYPDLISYGMGNVDRGMATNPQAKPFLDMIVSLLWFLNDANMDMYANIAATMPEIERRLTPESQAYVDKMKAGTYYNELVAGRDIDDPIKGTSAMLDLAKRIVREVFELDPDKKDEQPQPTASPKKAKSPPKEKKDEEGEGGEGEGEKDDGDGEGDAKDGEGEGEAGEGTGGDSSGNEPLEGERNDSKMVTVEYQEMVPNSHPMTELTKVPRDGIKITYDEDEGSHAYDPASKDKYVVVDFCKPANTTHPKFGEVNGGVEYVSYDESQLNSWIADAMKHTTTGFASRVRTRLQIRAKDRMEYGVKRGKLHGSLLHRVPRNTKLSEKVFKRTIVNDTLDTAVVWLGDGSSSMAGAKYGHMTAASVQFNEAVGNVLQVPIEIHVFTDTSMGARRTEAARPVMYVHRDFATRRLGEDELIRRMVVSGSHMYANPDGDAILWSYDRLMRAKAKRKLLIVASDGQPSTALPGDIDWYTKKVVKEIEDRTPIEIVGIGIMDDNVSRIYKENYVIKDAGELEQALLALIDKKVR